MYFSPFAKQNQVEVWPQFQSLLKLLLWTKGVEFNKVLNTLNGSLVPLSMFFVRVSACVQLCLGLCRRFCLWPGWGHCDNEGRKVGTLTDTCPSKFPAITFKEVCSRPPGAANHHLYNEQSQITCFNSKDKQYSKYVPKLIIVIYMETIIFFD